MDKTDLWKKFMCTVFLLTACIPPAARKDRTGTETCKLTINLIHGHTKMSIPGLIRITPFEGGSKPLDLASLIPRDNAWHTMLSPKTVILPRSKFRVEAIYGIETEKTEEIIDLTGKNQASVKIGLRQFYNASDRGLKSGNTHLHLKYKTRAQADRYLKVVPQADDLDLLYVSHLRRIPEEKDYITNEYHPDDMRKLSRSGVLFGYGEEHRHNLGPWDEGYGHVMFLGITELIKPVSLGPGIMKRGTDGIPLQRAIREAHNRGATVIWCHNASGYEGVPNFTAGLLDALNIFDGDAEAAYEETYYKYLNIGMKIPFSSGTDWFLYDFSRVYVPVEGKLTSRKWLKALREGKSFITNGTFLELSACGHTIGDTIFLEKPGSIEIVGRGIGRQDFKSIDLIYNGEVIHKVQNHVSDSHFAATMEFTLDLQEPGWIALRIPVSNSTSEFGHTLFAHTSPIFITIAGKTIFKEEIARQLIADIEQNINVIEDKSTFAGDKDKETVLKVHRLAIEALKERIATAQRLN